MRPLDALTAAAFFWKKRWRRLRGWDGE